MAVFLLPRDTVMLGKGICNYFSCDQHKPVIPKSLLRECSIKKISFVRKQSNRISPGCMQFTAIKMTQFVQIYYKNKCFTFF